MHFVPFKIREKWRDEKTKELVELNAKKLKEMNIKIPDKPVGGRKAQDGNAKPEEPKEEQKEKKTRRARAPGKLAKTLEAMASLMQVQPPPSSL